MDCDDKKECPKELLKPKWLEDFPVDADKDMNIARRDFIRFLCLVSAGLFMGTFWIFIKKFLPHVSAYKTFRILGREDIEVGGSYVFQLPDGNGPAILVRLNTNQYLAYSQKCTHLQCPVIWKAKESKLVCPCHHGAFDVQTGAVLYGPPDRALPKIDLEMKSDGVYFKSMDLLTSGAAR